MYKKNKVNYAVGSPTYLDFLQALRKMFTNDVDILPIVYGFNFYINGVYSIPYVDLFRMYDENMEDIHGAEKTKQLIDDGTVGVINKWIYSSDGSLVNALETLRIYLLDRSATYNIAFNPMFGFYSEAKKTVVNVLPNSNPTVSTNGITVGEMGNQIPQSIPRSNKKSFWKALGFLVYKPKSKKV